MGASPTAPSEVCPTRCAGQGPPSGEGPASLHLWSRHPPCAATADGDVGEAEGEKGDAGGGSDGPPEEEGRGGGVTVGADAKEQHHLGGSGGGRGMSHGGPSKKGMVSGEVGGGDSADERGKCDCNKKVTLKVEDPK